MGTRAVFICVSPDSQRMKGPHPDGGAPAPLMGNNFGEWGETHTRFGDGRFKIGSEHTVMTDLTVTPPTSARASAWRGARAGDKELRGV